MSDELSLQQQHMLKHLTGDDTVEGQTLRPGWSILQVLQEFSDILKKLPLRSEHEMADIGCGVGMHGLVFSRLVKHLWNIDPLEAALEKAKENLSGCPNCSFLQATAQELEFEEKFDRILAIGLLGHVEQGEGEPAVAAITRALKPGGLALLVSANDLEKRDAFLAMYLPQVRDAQHLSEERKQDIIRRNEGAAFFDFEALASVARRGRAEAEKLPTGTHHVMKLRHVGYPDICTHEYKFDMLIRKS